MRRALIFISIVVLFTLQLSGQTAPTSQPASNPSAAKAPKPVLILPFVSPPDAKYKEMGRDIQQDLANAIAADLRGQVSAPASTAPAADAAAALAVGRETDSSAVLFGRAQVNNGQVRLAGQVLDVSSGKTLGSLNQSGPVQDLFHLEDELTQQVVADLPEGLLNLRGLLSARPITRPQVIYLPSDAPMPDYSRPIDGGYAGPVAPYVLPPAPGGPPPYSPDAGSYPSRFMAPYAHLFSYDYDPDPFLPLPVYGGGFFPDRFGRRGVIDHPAVEHEPAAEPAHHR